MAKDLTVSRIDRQNILNNDLAIQEIQSKSGIDGILWEGKLYVTREDVSSYFAVDIRTIGRYIEQNNEELTQNGYEVLKGKRLKSFLEASQGRFAKDINVPSKIRQLGVFDVRAFLDLAMLLSESEKAKALRQMMLDIVIDLINRKTGGGTKYINQRDKDYVFASLQEDNLPTLSAALHPPKPETSFINHSELYCFPFGKICGGGSVPISIFSSIIGKYPSFKKWIDKIVSNKPEAPNVCP